MNSFLLAIQFLTCIPVKAKETFEEGQLSGAVIYFPLVGLILGLVLVGINSFLSFLLFNPFLIGVILTATLAVFTGALHLDGLADTFDALLSGKDKEGKLRIMRDPHLGTMGVLSLIGVVLLKVSALFSLGTADRNLALIFMCVLSRWALILPLYLFGYAREQGKAKGFFGLLTFRELFFGTLLVLIFAALIWNWKGISLFTLSLVFTYLFNSRINKKIDGITGDTLGAALELNEVLILAACLFLVKI